MAEPAPRPTITNDWIALQIRDATRDDGRAVAAANALRTNSAFINQFLSGGIQRGTIRTQSQTETTITIFNALYQIPSFRLLLSSVVADRIPDPARDDPTRTSARFPQFGTLLSFLMGNDGLNAQASAEIIRAADYFIRYFLLEFIASANMQFRNELTQLSGDGNIAWRLERASGARAAGGTRHDCDERAFPFLGGAMDADTMVAAALWIRRWSQEHPQNGRGRTQIAAWQSPAVIPLEAQGQTAPTAPIQTPVLPRIAIVGDSITAIYNGRTGTTLQASLRNQFPGAQVMTLSHGGDQLPAIRSQFRQRVISARPPYNTVIIQGGVNSIASGVSVEDCKRIFTQMINEARAANLRVILVTVTPTVGARNRLYSGADRQVGYAELNQWLRAQASGNDIVVVDLAALGEGTPPKWRQQYDSGDHIHPSPAGSDQIASLIVQAAYAQRTQPRQEIQSPPPLQQAPPPPPPPDEGRRQIRF